MSLTAQDVSTIATGRLIGDPGCVIRDAKPVHTAGPDDLTFATDRKKLKIAIERAPGVVVVPPALADEIPGESPSTFIVAADPQNVVLLSLARLHPPQPAAEPGISPHAFISESAQIGEDVTIHACVHIGDDAVIGDRCVLHPGVVIGANCRLGDDVTLAPYVVLYPNVEIGSRVDMQPGVILGGDGFGYRTKDGNHQRVAHFGTLKIGDDVDIGALSTFDRAVIGTTLIGDGTKIGNLVAVAHNCELGKHNLLVSQVGFAGSVTTGEYVVCAGQVGVGDHVHLGDHCTLAAKTGVHRDLPGNQLYLGAPAAPIEQTTKQMMALRKLPEMRQTVRSLEKQVAALTLRLEKLMGDEETHLETRAA
ncbi:MAG: UDP-3-O-(3-hydroxymyristoyl)glucosamine N-acyltransferase [Planctomycetota bacterium]|nr:UDP-3-O-(3-hydroxymyristoyl)glucosamine N-acyltransferase [Planctomycetota bacterium]MDA1248946.1 UDP-3-O-(3-hydroxymyristoyl)glucosamine N-acyltransferase [Planctomycetota bacterium]